MLNVVVVLTCLTQGLVGLFVLQKRRNSLTNLTFAMLSLVNLAWAVVNYIYTLNPVSAAALTQIRFVIFLVVIENTLFYIFAKTYPSNRQVISSRKLALVLIASAVVAAVALTPGIFKSVTVINDQSNPNPGPLIILFMAHAVYTIGGGLRSLIKKNRQAYGIQRRQFQYILFASFLNWLLVPVTNFVLTLTLHTTFFARVSPFYTLAFAGIIAYAIVAQKLFDIRAAVARSVAYVLLVGTLAAAYLAVFFGVINVVFAGAGRETAREVSLIVLMFPIIVSFQRLRNYFDRITNRLFYRDSYDTQEILDKLGEVVVADIDLHRILSGTRRVLSDAVRCSFMEYILIEDGQPKLALPMKLDGQTDINRLDEALKQSKGEIISREQISPSHPLRAWFDQYDIAVSLKLKTQRQVVGFILFGDKRSGDIYNKQDFGLLTITADELGIAIQNALRFEQIQRFNVTLQEKVDEATRQLRHANQRLRELDATKDEFISMASHQLRTPLTTIKGYLSMVLEGDVGPVSKNEKAMIQKAFDGAERMVFLIADLLNVSRLQSGKFVIDNKPTDLAKMIESEVDQLKDTAKHHNLELTFKRPERFPLLNLDDTKIRQVIMNFMDNAIYYTPAGGSIEVALEAAEHEIRYTVTDTGLGVPKTEQHHLFTKFYRAGNARKMRPDGTGLGLFMAKKVITAQGGAVIFNSTEGKGSTFGFSFPRSKLEVKSKAPEKPVAETAVA